MVTKKTTKNNEEEQLTTLYECVVCNKVKETIPGKKLAIYMKETLGARTGFMCPDCEKKNKK